MKFNIDLSGLNKTRKAKARIVITEMDKVINSSLFEENLYNKLHDSSLIGETSNWGFIDALSIVEQFMSGGETLSPLMDKEMDMKILPWYSWRHIVGFTYANVEWIKVNTKYFDKNSYKLIGSNFVHEYGHKVSFSHEPRGKDMRKSICYILNEAYEETHDKLFEDHIIFKTVCTGYLWWKKCKRVRA